MIFEHQAKRQKKSGLTTTTSSVMDYPPAPAHLQLDPPPVVESDMKPISLQSIRKDHVKHDMDCFGCKYGFGKPKDAKEEPEMAAVWSAFVDNRTRMCDTQLFNLISEVQQKMYVEPFENDNEDVCPTWTSEQVEEHINYHMFHYEFEVRDDLNALKHQRKFIEDYIGKEDTNKGTRKPDKEMMDMLLKTIQARQAIMVRFQKEQHSQL